MKATVLLLLVLAHGIANAEQSAAPPHKDDKPRVCRIGKYVTYIGEHDECLDTREKCEAKGGSWGGTLKGRGRFLGCELPTADAGTPCTNKSQCQGACIPENGMTPPCVCDRWKHHGGGHQRYCTAEGVRSRQID